MSLKILLIVPKLSLNTPPLGVGYLASFLEQHNYDADIICTGDIDDSTLVRTLRRENPSMIGFTTLTVWMKEVYRIASLVKSLMPDCVVVCGGVHASALPILTLEECKTLDAIVIGEGEETFLELIQAIGRRRDFDRIKGLAFRKGSKIKKNPERRKLAKLDHLPFPKREFLGRIKTLNEVDVLPARGCPFNCIECSYSAVSGRELRMRSSKNVVDEIEFLVDDFSPATVTFTNCTSTLRKSWIITFCREMQDRGLNDKCKLDITTRPDALNNEVVRMLARSGCEKISLWTVNSGDDRILLSSGRNYATQHVKDAVVLCKSYNIRTLVGFTFGNPYETVETAWNTIQFAKNLKANEYWFGINRPFPGSELYQIGLRDGYDIQGRWDEYEMRPEYPTKLPSPRTNLSSNRLFELLKETEKRVINIANHHAVP